MRILLVDDDRETVAFMQSVLQADGHQVVTAHDGQRALSLAELSRPDLLILELLLPVRSGFWVLEQLHEMPLPSIVTTTVQKRQHRDYAQELGVLAYLSKPFTTDQLLAAIVQADSRHALQAS